MRTKEIQRFVGAYIQPHLEGYSMSGKILFKEPARPVLRGFYFEDSEFNPKSVYTWAFIQPLYLPKDYIFFTFGKRLRRSVGFLRSREDWGIGDPPDQDIHSLLLQAIRSKGIPHLARLATPDLIIRNLRAATGLRDNPYALEAIAYSYARLGNPSEAESRLKKVMRSASRENKFRSIVERGQRLLAAIQAGADETTKLLDAWEKETIRKLKLPH